MDLATSNCLSSSGWVGDDQPQTTVETDFAEAARYIGELYAAAAHDVQTCNPSDIDLHGHPILEWRKAYLEGCKDMAEGIVTRIPDALRENIKEIITSAAIKERARLSEEAAHA